MFKDILDKCVKGAYLTELEAQAIMDEIMENRGTPSQIASLLSILRFRGETVDEMVGFARSMKKHSLSIPHNEQHVIDTCGTGGDHAHTFNISTATAIALSAVGQKVAKHGNRSVSSKSGSADVLEKLNIPIQSTPEGAANALHTKGMCFLFAPLYHEAMKHAVIPRKEIGFRTIFNLLGPLTNPANANAQLIGVFNHSFAEKMAKTLDRLGGKRALFVTGGEGLDELSITSHTSVVELKNGVITNYEITPEEVGLERYELRDIQVQTAEESAALIEAVFKGEKAGAAKEIIALNGGAGLYVGGAVETIKEGVYEIKAALENGKVYDQYLRLQEERLGEEYA